MAKDLIMEVGSLDYEIISFYKERYGCLCVDGCLAYDKGRYSIAIGLFKQALEYCTSALDEAKCYERLASCHENLNKIVAAISYLEQCIVTYNEGDISEFVGPVETRLSNCRVKLKNAIELAEHKHNKGVEQYQRNNFEDALSSFSVAVKIFAANDYYQQAADAYICLASCHSKLNNSDERYQHTVNSWAYYKKASNTKRANKMRAYINKQDKKRRQSSERTFAKNLKKYMGQNRSAMNR